MFIPHAKQLHDYWQLIRRAVADARGDDDALAARLAADGDTRSADVIRRMAARWSQQAPAVLDSLTDEKSDDWLSDPVLDDLSRRVRCPVLCVNGDPGAGSMVTTDQGVRQRAVYRGSDEVRLDRMDHGLGLDGNPAPVLDAMRPFLTGLV